MTEQDMLDAQTCLLIDALRLYQRSNTVYQGVDIDTLCEQLNMGDIALKNMSKPLATYHLAYSYVDAEGTVKQGLDWECEAENLEQAVEKLIKVIEVPGSYNRLIDCVPLGNAAAESELLPPLIRQDDEDGYQLIKTPEANQVYISVGNIDVKVNQTDEGVVVDLFDRCEGLEPLASTYAFFSEASYREIHGDDELSASDSVSPSTNMG